MLDRVRVAFIDFRSIAIVSEIYRLKLSLDGVDLLVAVIGF